MPDRTGDVHGDFGSVQPPPADKSPAAPPSTRRYLLDSETLVFAVRRHAAVLIRPTLIAVVPLALAIWLLVVGAHVQALAILGVVLLLAVLGWYGWKIGDWAVERFTVTDRRVLLISGLLTRRVAIMPLRKVTDLTFERSVTGRLFGFGAFVMESAGQHQALSRIDYLPHPELLYRQMSDLLFGRRGVVSTGAGAAGGPGNAGGGERGIHDTGDLAGYGDHRAHDGERWNPGSGAPRTGVASGSLPHRQATTPLPELARDRPVPRRPRAPW